MMEIKSYVYRIRKRINDKTLLKLKEIIDTEINRRTEAEELSSAKKRI